MGRGRVKSWHRCGFRIWGYERAKRSKVTVCMLKVELQKIILKITIDRVDRNVVLFYSGVIYVNESK